MDKTKTVKTRKTPTPAFAVISFLVIVAVLVALINLGVDTTMSVFIAALIAVVIALLLDIPWADVERTLLRVVSDCIPTFLIVIMVGMLVGIWMAGGTVPALMYYGMKLISPKILVPLAFVLSGLTAEFTGTSFGSVATMGIALVGVASTTSIPVPLVIAAVVCGAWFGDKMSPLSDTTNLASGVSRVPLYDHIGSMMYTTIPAALVALVLFTAAGYWAVRSYLDLENLDFVFWVLGITTSIVAVLYVLNIFNIDLIGAYADTAVVERAQFFSTLGQKDFNGCFFSVALPIVFYQFLNVKDT